jgi:hypothetical protein
MLLRALKDLESQHHLQDTKVEEKYERCMEHRKAAAEQLARTLIVVWLGHKPKKPPRG